ncbi:MAG: ABC transporter permease [Amphiplicatus sp.]
MASVSTALDTKLFRDLWRIKGQGFAIAAVIAAGVALFVMSDGMLSSLRETMNAYYERYRFADAFAPVKRAPLSALADIARLPGVARIEGRIHGAALVDAPDIAAPITGEVVSLSPFDAAPLNDVYIVKGRKIDFTRAREILLLEPFATAHGLKPGDEIEATVYGAKRTFFIAGLALSPEHIYTIAPGEFVPNPARYAVLWMSRDAAEAAFDMDGAFNEAVLTVEPGARMEAVLAGLDRTLAPYGATGAYDRSDQLSNRFLSEELRQLDMMGRLLPPIFLSVAAFLLNMVVSRMVDAERTQIGLMKAFGYTNPEVAMHYAKFAFALAAIGAVAGCFFGLWLGRGMAQVYQAFYKFPFLIFSATPSTFFVGLMVSFAAAGLGVVLAVRGAVVLTPAEAMRPPAPADFTRVEALTRVLERPLDQPTRIVLRRLVRRPLRAVLTSVGVGAAMSLVVMMDFNRAAIDDMIDVSFNVVDRSDLVVRFVEPLSRKAVYELKRVDGVIAAEPGRDVPVMMRNGRKTRLGAITGLPPEARLNRAVDDKLRTIPMREDGLIISRSLADLLSVGPGDPVVVEAREGRRPTVVIPVAAVASTLMGTPAYMDIEALSRLLGEGWRASNASLLVDPLKRDDVFAKIKDMPKVAGVASAREAQRAFQKLIDEGSGVFRNLFAFFAILITIGVVYNSARIAFAEAAHELASLRVLGFTKGEAAYVLLGEIFALTLAALPIGAGLGYGLWRYMAKAFSNELYQIPVVVTPAGFGGAALVVLAAAAASGALVFRDVAKLDMVSALKARE